VTFTAHAAVGGGLTALLTRILGGDPTVGLVVGAVLGSAPDTVDWIAWKLGWCDRWSLYVLMHHEVHKAILIVLFPMGLHVWLDSYIHKVPGGNWWPKYWWTEVLMWVVGGILIWRTYAR
jgi:hypothetical protein